MKVTPKTRSIQELDEKLAIYRESWMDATPNRKPFWMAKIDAALDARIALMHPAPAPLITDH